MSSFTGSRGASISGSPGFIPEDKIHRENENYDMIEPSDDVYAFGVMMLQLVFYQDYIGPAYVLWRSLSNGTPRTPVRPYWASLSHTERVTVAKDLAGQTPKVSGLSGNLKSVALEKMGNLVFILSACYIKDPTQGTPRLKSLLLVQALTEIKDSGNGQVSASTSRAELLDLQSSEPFATAYPFDAPFDFFQERLPVVQNDLQRLRECASQWDWLTKTQIEHREFFAYAQRLLDTHTPVPPDVEPGSPYAAYCDYNRFPVSTVGCNTLACPPNFIIKGVRYVTTDDFLSRLQIPADGASHARGWIQHALSAPTGGEWTYIKEIKRREALGQG